MLQPFLVASVRGLVCEAPPDFGDGAAAVFKNKLNFEQTFTNSKNPTSQVHIFQICILNQIRTCIRTGFCGMN